VTGGLLAGVAVAIAAVALGHYASTVRAVRVALRPRAHQAGVAIAAACAIAALASGPGWPGGIAAALVLLVATLFFLTTSLSRIALGGIRVAVGAPAIDFTARDSTGAAFALSSRRGRRVLLKFFRGHWCPYCTAELRQWQELRPALAALGIEVVAISPDSVEEAAGMREKHGLGMTIVSDEALAVIDAYGVRHAKAFSTNKGFIRPLAIPTTILIDEDFVVRWIDQADDFRVRSEASRVVSAVRAALGVTG
jgi:peroxiredoxin